MSGGGGGFGMLRLLDFGPFFFLLSFACVFLGRGEGRIEN